MSTFDLTFRLLVVVDNHEPRAEDDESRVDNHESRVDNHEPRVENHEPRVDNHEPRANDETRAKRRSDECNRIHDDSAR